jgi:hypothetical protein
MLLLLMYVLVLGVVAYVITVLPIHETFKTIAWGIIAIILIVLLFQAATTHLPGLR